MKVLIQRVARASVRVGGEVVGRIDRGLLLFVGVEHADTDDEARAAAAKVAGLRLFSDAEGRLNLAVGDVGGAALVVSQFTLAASLRRGRRPSFEAAAEPERARHVVDIFAAGLAQAGLPVATGVFGADMQVELVNDGPVTFLLEWPQGPRRQA